MILLKFLMTLLMMYKKQEGASELGMNWIIVTISLPMLLKMNL